MLQHLALKYIFMILKSVFIYYLIHDAVKLKIVVDNVSMKVHQTAHEESFTKLLFIQGTVMITKHYTAPQKVSVSFIINTEAVRRWNSRN